jgi:hypothetical protein
MQQIAAQLLVICDDKCCILITGSEYHHRFIIRDRFASLTINDLSKIVYVILWFLFFFQLILRIIVGYRYQSLISSRQTS